MTRIPAGEFVCPQDFHAPSYVAARLAWTVDPSGCLLRQRALARQPVAMLDGEKWQIGTSNDFWLHVVEPGRYRITARYWDDAGVNLLRDVLVRLLDIGRLQGELAEGAGVAGGDKP